MCIRCACATGSNRLATRWHASADFQRGSMHKPSHVVLNRALKHKPWQGGNRSGVFRERCAQSPQMQLSQKLLPAWHNLGQNRAWIHKTFVANRRCNFHRLNDGTPPAKKNINLPGRLVDGRLQKLHALQKDHCSRMSGIGFGL